MWGEIFHSILKKYSFLNVQNNKLKEQQIISCVAVEAQKSPKIKVLF